MKEIVQKIRETFGKRISIRSIAIGLLMMILAPYILRYLTGKRIGPELLPAERVLGIKQLVTDVQSELRQLEKERIARKEAALFKVTNFDLEISFVVRADSREKSGIKYQIVTAESEFQRGLENVQKLTLHMATAGGEKLEGEFDDPTLQDELGELKTIGVPPVRKGDKP